MILVSHFVFSLWSLCHLYLDGFRVAKIYETKDQNYCVSLFHYKLDTKSKEEIIEDDILMHLGNINSKQQIFELDNNGHKNMLIKLTEKLTEIRTFSYIFFHMKKISYPFLLEGYQSMIHFIDDMQKKDKVCLFSLYFLFAHSAVNIWTGQTEMNDCFSFLLLYKQQKV
jgi:hypothetical protein